MECCFCGRTVESIEEAIELGWYPDFWVGDTNYQGPICAECQSAHLDTDTDGEYVLKQGHSVPPLAMQPGFVKIRKGKDMSQLLTKPKFSLGEVLTSVAAFLALEKSGQTPEFFLEKHVQGDWGTLAEEDKRANNQAVVDGSRILSAYQTLLGVKIWIITEAADDSGRRAASTILLPSEY